MKKFNLLYIIVIFSLLLLVQNFLILRAVREMNGDARVVNYSGLVRGATQRLVKLELSHHPDDELMARLEEYLHGLAGQQNDYDIVYMAYEPFQDSIADLLVIWDELKASIRGYREGLTSGEALLEVSERHFAKADEATHNAEYGSEGKLGSTELLISAGMAVISVIVLIVAISMYLLRRSERRQMELLQKKNEQLEAAILEANEANRAKSVFLSHMSHDIRTPLNGIIGMTSIASGNLTNPVRMRDCLRKIDNSSRLLQSLVNDVLDMSKIESGKFLLSDGEIFLPEFTQGLVNILGEQVKTKRQRLSVAAFSVRHERLRGDMLRLNQLFINILSNSVKFTPAGGDIGFAVKELPCAREGFARFEFTCSDTGIGMNEDFIQHVFESFSREEDSRIDKIEGSGLGLAITKRVVDIMNGEIIVESEKNKGTRFVVTLEFPTGAEAAAPNTLKGMRVLVADGDEAVCADAKAQLESLGVTAFAATGTAEALALTDAGEAFDAAIIDWDLPGEGGGIKLCQSIRRKAGGGLPVFISAVDWAELEQEAAAAGATGFIQKPLYRSTLLSRIGLSLLAPGEKPEGGAPGAGLRLEGLRVLMAEDNELNTEIAVEILGAAGIVLDCAANGKEAVEMFAACEPSTYAMILMDMQMPVMTGCEAAAAIRKLPHAEAASIPIIAMTANAFAEDIREALAAGMNAHVAKPVNFETLKAVMAKFLPASAMKAAAQNKTAPAQAAAPSSLLDALAPYGLNAGAGLARFGGNKKAYENILKRFPADKSFETLREAIREAGRASQADEAGQLSQASREAGVEAAAKAAHTLKGIAANLSMDTFAETLFQLEQALKQGNYDQALSLFEQAGSLYEVLVEVIGKY